MCTASFLSVLSFARRKSRRMFKKATVLTHPTPARQDAPFRRRGRSKRKAEAYAVGTLRP